MDSERVRCKVVKVTVFGFEGKDYAPGDVVEVPKRFATLDFLKRVPKSKSSEKNNSSKAKETKKGK